MPSLPFAALVDTSAALADTRSRKRKTALIAELLAPLDEQDAYLLACYLTGTLAQGRIGIGYRTVQAHLSKEGMSTSDDGALTLQDLHQALDALAAVRGPGSKAARGQLLEALGARLPPAERDYLARLLVGEVRHGALDGVLADAIAQAYQLAPELVRRAAMLGGDLPAVARLASRGDRSALADIGLRLLHPVQPMLAQTAADVADALARFPAAVFESKLDGARVQIHRLGDTVRVFTRQLHDVSGAVPELVEWALARATPAFIVEGEAIALRDDGRPLAFQSTMRRFGRRLDVPAMRREIPLSLRVFDCLHHDGEDLIDQPLSRRLEALQRLAPSADQVTRLITTAPDEVEAFVQTVLASGHEGVMAKDLSAPYAAGRRGGAWLKLKPTHTADLVLVGCEWGSGRRQGMLSNLRLAARDGEHDTYVLVGKTFKGLTDEVLRWQTEHLPPLASAQDAYAVELPPRIVYEIAFDGVQTSAQYAGGLALRFARYRRRRDDKRPEHATTLDELRALLHPA